MMALVDASVVLRKLFREPAPLAEWTRIRDAFASRLMPIEVGRVIDRARLAGSIDDAQVVVLHEELRRALRAIEIIDLTEPILTRAAGPMPTTLGTLDAIHLATAIELRTVAGGPLVLATHDVQLARAARASGLDVVGVASGSS
jgi:predicted nucleic acid-binding protein